MMKLGISAAILMTALASSAASANWRYTKPGMKPIGVVGSAKPAPANSHDDPGSDISRGRAVVEQAMRHLEFASRADAEKASLPEHVYLDTLLAALSFPTAWVRPQQSHQSRDQDKYALMNMGGDGAMLFYLEWGCHTQREEVIAREFVELIPQIVTTYTERLFLKAFIQARERFGYSISRLCDQKTLHEYRAYYEANRKEVRSW